MTVSDPAAEDFHAGNLEYDEVDGGEVDETEEDEEGGAEVECKHSVVLHQFQGLGMQLLAYLGGHVVGGTELLLQDAQQTLELRGGLFLLTGI